MAPNYMFRVLRLKKWFVFNCGLVRGTFSSNGSSQKGGKVAWNDTFFCNSLGAFRKEYFVK